MKQLKRQCILAARMFDPTGILTDTEKDSFTFFARTTGCSSPELLILVDVKRKRVSVGTPKFTVEEGWREELPFENATGLLGNIWRARTTAGNSQNVKADPPFYLHENGIIGINPFVSGGIKIHTGVQTTQERARDDWKIRLSPEERVNSTFLRMSEAFFLGNRKNFVIRKCTQRSGTVPPLNTELAVEVLATQ